MAETTEALDTDNSRCTSRYNSPEIDTPNCEREEIIYEMIANININILGDNLTELDRWHLTNQ